MPVGRSLSALNLYDIQGNLIPGVYFVLLAFVLVYPWSSIMSILPGSSVAFAAYALILGVVFGRVIQAVGSFLERLCRSCGRCEWCGKGIEAEFKRRTKILEKMSSPVGPLEEAESEAESTDWILNNPATVEFLPLCEDKFDLKGDLEDNESLLFLVMSYLETHGIGRATRFEALHSFYRSIWSASLLALGVSGLVLVFNTEINPMYNIVDFRLGPSPFWFGAIVVAIIVTAGIFWRRKNKFEDLYVRYVILDFYQDHVTNEGTKPNEGLY